MLITTMMSPGASNATFVGLGEGALLGNALGIWEGLKLGSKLGEPLG